MFVSWRWLRLYCGLTPRSSTAYVLRGGLGSSILAVVSQEEVQEMFMTSNRCIPVRNTLD